MPNNKHSKKVYILDGGSLVIDRSGAGQGMGRAIAEKLRAEGAGVIVADKNAETAGKTAAEIGGTAHVTDVSDPDQVSALIAAAVGQFGKIDILVNDAAIVPFVPWEELHFAEWRRVMSVNIDGVFLMCKAVYPHMKAAGYGRIVNIASNVVTAGTPNMAHYVSSKGAVFAFTRSLATEVGAHGITVNAVAPGLTASEVAQARLIVGSVASTPFAADTTSLLDASPGDFASRAESCAGAAATACTPVADGEASPDYLRHLVAVHARQALGEAFAAA